MIGWTESDKEEREWEVGAKFTHNYCNCLENMTKETKPQFLVCEKYGTGSCHANGTAQFLPWHGENATANFLPRNIVLPPENVKKRAPGFIDTFPRRSHLVASGTFGLSAEKPAYLFRSSEMRVSKVRLYLIEVFNCWKVNQNVLRRVRLIVIGYSSSEWTGTMVAP